MNQPSGPVFWGDQLQVVKMFLFQSTTWSETQGWLRNPEAPAPVPKSPNPNHASCAKIEQNWNQVTCSRNVAVESIAQKLSGLEESTGCAFEEVVGFRSLIMFI